MLPRALLVLMAIIGLAAAATARDARTLLHAGTARGDASRIPVEIDLRMVADILDRRDDTLTILLPLPGIGTREVTLHRSSAITNATRIRTSDTGGTHTVPVGGIVAYSGTVASMPASVATLVITPEEIVASVDAGADNWTLGRERAYTNGQHVMARMKSTRADCRTDDMNVGAAVDKAMRDRKLDGSVQGDEQLTLEVSIEADYQFFDFMSANETKALAYIARLMAITDEIYRRDFNVKVDVTDIHLWATKDDPYEDTLGVFEMIDVFIDKYSHNHTDVQRDIAVLMTHRVHKPSGGQAKAIGSICVEGQSYCVGSVAGDLPDSPQANAAFDAVLFPHEIGHVCGGVHTQSCMWIGGPLDSCVVSELERCVTADMIRPRIGTIMSYCHIVENTGGGIKLEFHPRHRQVIRSFLERSVCVGQGGVDSVRSLSGTVRYAETMLPAAGVTLEMKPYRDVKRIFQGIPDVVQATATTDADGHYRFDSLHDGWYTVVMPTGYVPGPVVVADTERAVEVLIAGNHQVRDFELVPAYPVTIVYDPQGRKDSITLVVVSDRFEQLQQVVLFKDTVIARGPVTRYLPPGTCVLIPLTSGIDMQPARHVLHVGTSLVPDTVVFTGSRATVRGEPAVVVCGYANGGAHLLHAGDSVRIQPDGAPQRTYASDEYGIVVTERIDTTASVAITLAADTTVLVPHVRYGATTKTGIVAPQVLWVRDRTWPRFVNRYAFASSVGTYEHFEGENLWSPQMAAQGAVPVDLPMPIIWGNRTSTHMWVYGTGAVSFGPEQLGSMPFYHTALGEADMVVSALAGHFAQEPEEPMAVQWAVHGQAPDRTLVVQWSNIRMYCYSTLQNAYYGPAEFQIHLSETGDRIELRYGAFPKLPTGVTMRFGIGLRGTDGYDDQTVRVSTKAQWSNPNVQVGVAPATSSAILNSTSTPEPGQTYIWTLQPVSVDEASPGGEWSVGPNPVDSKIHIGMPHDAAAHEAVDVWLVDITGRVVQHATDTCELDVSACPAGMYVLHVGYGAVTRSFPIAVVR